jgi:hypothetical protein
MYLQIWVVAAVWPNHFTGIMCRGLAIFIAKFGESRLYDYGYLLGNAAQ